MECCKMTNKRIAIHYTVMILGISLVVSLMAENTFTNNRTYNYAKPLSVQPLRVFEQLVQKPNNLSNIMQLEQYQISYSYIYQLQKSITTTTIGKSAVSTINDDNIQKGSSATSNKVANYFHGRYYDGRMAGFQCSLNGSSASVCASPFVSLISLASTAAIAAVPKKLCQPVAAGTPIANMHISSHLVNFIEAYEGNAGML